MVQPKATPPAVTSVDPAVLEAVQLSELTGREMTDTEVGEQRAQMC